MNQDKIKSIFWMVRAELLGKWVDLLRRWEVTHKHLNRLETKLWTASRLSRKHKTSLATAVPYPTNGEPVNTMSVDQIAWDSLVDRRFFSRHLPPHTRSSNEYHLPSTEALLNLFKRPIDTVSGKELQKRGRGNLLFVAFAQWLTDGVFRSDYKDKRKTTSSHHIDLAQVYGSTIEETVALRSGEGGMLRLDEDLLPPRLFRNTQRETDFSELSYVGEEMDASINLLSQAASIPSDEYSLSMRATGLKTGTLSVGNFIITTLFAREHNRICNLLADEYPRLNDEELFNFARNITTIRALQIILKDYIGFITDKDHYSLDPSLTTKVDFHGGWLPIEFNLLYRWHGSVPDSLLTSEGEHIDWRTGMAKAGDVEFNHLLSLVLKQPCGEIGLNNTPSFLLEAEKHMLEMGRKWNLAPYAEYCRAFDLPVSKSFKDFTDDDKLDEELATLYGETNFNEMDFIVGLFAQKKYGDCVLGQLMMRMVAYEAFTNIYANPLLASENYNEKAFTEKGMEWLAREVSLDDLIRENTKFGDDDLGMDVYFKDQTIGFHPLKDSSCPHAASQDPSIKQDQLEQTLCPVLRTGINSGDISLDKEGWAFSDDLKDYMDRIGFKKDSKIVNFIVGLAARATGKRLIKRQIRVTGFKGTFQDHGSSSRVLHVDRGVNEERLRDFLEVVSDGATFGKRELAEAVLKFHRNAEAYGGHKSRTGAIFQLLEMGSILRIFGKKRDGDNHITLSKDDIKRLWVENKYPEHFDSTAVRPDYGSWESALVLIQMLWYFVCADVRGLYKNDS